MSATTNTSKTETICDDETSTTFAIPVTLRQVEAAGILLDGAFGIDGSEHDEMLDETGLLRALFGVQLADEGEVAHTFDLECFQGRISRFGQEAKWESCTRRFYSAKGWVDRQNYARNSSAIEAMLETVFPAYKAMLRDAAVPFEEWIASTNAETDDSEF